MWRVGLERRFRWDTTVGRGGWEFYLLTTVVSLVSLQHSTSEQYL